MGFPTEEARLGALQQLDLLDTPPAEDFDRITRMAAQLFSLPIAAISLTDLDRQWFKARVGIEHTWIPRYKAPCAQVAESSGCLVIPDLRADAIYQSSPLAESGVRFYAGAPLVTREGFCLGAMCVLGMHPRQISPVELSALRDLAAMVMAQIELRHAFGRIDPLSGMPNRNQFVEDLEDLARDRPNPDRRIAVLIDLASPEQLGSATRVMGPSYLDDMVQAGARALRGALGKGRRAYHIATTQFIFLAPENAEVESYIQLVEQQMGEIASVINPRFMSAVAVGLAPFTLGSVKPPDLLRTLHSAAQDARGSDSRISVYSPEQDAAHRRSFALIRDFEAALEQPHQLRLVYQPRIDLASGTCVGAEALLRWTHPGIGEVSPGEFMPLVERTTMAQPATAWVLETAMRQAASWYNAGIDMQLSVNVSATNLMERDFAFRLEEGLRRHCLPASQLELEITESAVMGDAGQALALLQVIADTGIRLAIDDFGTGYSSLSYLQQLPAHVVKIDQSFMRDIVHDERRRSLVAAMISLSHDLGYRVVAEGVESQAVLDILKMADCDEAQGYLFGRPMASADFLHWLPGPSRNHDRARL
jgi:EAL domain-containing protein (putative c-di-GMP-specific phosphodiesterase class I)/GGDEF domain-containing protein